MHANIDKGVIVYASSVNWCVNECLFCGRLSEWVDVCVNVEVEMKIETTNHSSV